MRSLTPRPQFPHGNYVEFADALAKEIGILPVLPKPGSELHDILANGPVVPAQYRFLGRHAKPELAQISLIEAYSRALSL